MSIALKEANETDYWLMLLADTNYTNVDDSFRSLQRQCRELISMLVATVKTARS